MIGILSKNYWSDFAPSFSEDQPMDISFLGHVSSNLRNLTTSFLGNWGILLLILSFDPKRLERHTFLQRGCEFCLHGFAALSSAKMKIKYSQRRIPSDQSPLVRPAQRLPFASASQSWITPVRATSVGSGRCPRGSGAARLERRSLCDSAAALLALFVEPAQT